MAKKPREQALFEVPVSLYPHVVRAGVGRFNVGDELYLPDAASKPGDLVHRDLIPKNPTAVALLERSNKVAAARAAGASKGTDLPAMEALLPKDDDDDVVVKPDIDPDPGLTVRQVAENGGIGNIRQADK